MKVLTLAKIREFANLILQKTIPTEKTYEYELQGSEEGFFIPNYEQKKSFIEVYKNGLRLCEEREYKVYETLGQIVLTNTEHVTGDRLLVIHKKYN